MTEKVKFVRKVSIVIREIELLTPTDKETAHAFIMQEDTQEKVVDSMVIFETTDDKTEYWNEEALMAESLHEAIIQ